MKTERGQIREGEKNTTRPYVFILATFKISLEDKRKKTFGRKKIYIYIYIF